MKHKTISRAQKQLTGSIERIKARYQPIFIWAINIWQRDQEHTVVERQPLNTWYWENWPTTCKRSKGSHLLIIFDKISSKCIRISI